MAHVVSYNNDKELRQRSIQIMLKILQDKIKLCINTFVNIQCDTRYIVIDIKKFLLIFK